MLEETTTELEVIADQFDPNSPLFSSQTFEDPELGLYVACCCAFTLTPMFAELQNC
jgi:hypothetical protein